MISQLKQMSFAFTCKDAAIEFKSITGLKSDCDTCFARLTFLIWVDSLPLSLTHGFTEAVPTIPNLKEVVGKVTMSHAWAESASISMSEEMYHKLDQQWWDLMCDRLFVCLYKTMGGPVSSPCSGRCHVPGPPCRRYPVWALGLFWHPRKHPGHPCGKMTLKSDKLCVRYHVFIGTDPGLLE